MYYKILDQVFQQDEVFASKRIIEQLDNFIREQTELGFSYLNPYKFSTYSKITLKESVQLFLFFTENNFLFSPQFFIDCPYCVGEDIKIENYDKFIDCEECRKSFDLESLKEKVYVMFKLNDFIEIPNNKKTYSLNDPNSTFEILQNTPPSLKKAYPLSSESEKEDKGNNNYVSFSELEEFNEINGNNISDSASNLADDIFKDD